jgi:soluble lytic murein transglycosylase-like protein
MEVITTIISIAKSVGVSGTLLLAICNHESGGFMQSYSPMDHGTPSYGSCQIKYNTALQLGFKGLPIELMRPEVGVKYAALYLRYQQKRYGNNWIKIVSSYNSGSYSLGRNGCPRNARYVRLVRNKLPLNLQEKLNCGTFGELVDN